MRIAAGILLALLLSAGCASLAPRSRAPGPEITTAGVHFRFFAPSAHRVQLAGSWPGNNWARGDGSVGEADVGLMEDDDNDGVWEIVVPLAPGRYQYLFWVDEASWRLDPGNSDEVDGGPARRASEILVVQRGESLEVR
ncbi:MAG TPA: glycogen-binding domain-containing protein [Candidatus Krumholzibacteria bacterium]|nr:glycogen-binding domain-containing protein [Candidatus Krumholzibacteria bacterium]